MNAVFALTNDKSWKSVLVENDRLLLINRSYSNATEFLDGYNDTGLSKLLKSKKEILIQDIAGMKHDEKQAQKLVINYNGKKTTLEFASGEDLRTAAGFIAAKRQLRSNVETKTTWQAIQNPGIGLLVTLAMTWVLYTEAQTIEAGGIIETEGRRAWVKKLFANLAELLGTQGVLIVGAVATGVCLYFMFKRFSNPPNQVVYI